MLGACCRTASAEENQYFMALPPDLSNHVQYLRNLGSMHCDVQVRAPVDNLLLRIKYGCLTLSVVFTFEATLRWLRHP
jgi:hypothetical protein